MFAATRFRTTCVRLRFGVGKESKAAPGKVGKLFLSIATKPLKSHSRPTLPHAFYSSPICRTSSKLGMMLASAPSTSIS